MAMADRGSFALSPRLDVQQLPLEAQNRWLRPAEICEILCNFQKFHIATEPPTRPPSGSLFLFDRKVLRYFRKDGHNWRKKKDGKTVKEAHEKLKVGSVDVLHCYYAHGEENENFQRRSYWMLQEDLMHIVFVHYLEVKGNRTTSGAAREADEAMLSSRLAGPKSFSSSTSHGKVTFGNVDAPSPSSSLTSYEDAESEDSHQATSRYHSFTRSPQMGNGFPMDKAGSGLSSFYSPHPYESGTSAAECVSQVQEVGFGDSNGGTCVIESQKTLCSASWEEIFQQCITSAPSHVSPCSTEPASSGVVHGGENMVQDKFLAGNNATKEEYGIQWQNHFEDNSLAFQDGHVDQLSDLGSVYGLGSTLSGEETPNEPILPNNLHLQLANGESEWPMKLSSENDMSSDGHVPYLLTLRQSLLDGEEGLKKVDSFSRWVSKELGEVEDLRMQPSSGIAWSTVECGDLVDDSSLSPSLSQDQLFSISNLSPKWTYTDLEIEVLIIGRFLGIRQDIAKLKWSCMFGEVEVPAEVLADGILCCRAPPHSVGLVPFYVTCSNRLACSEVREFDYLAGSAKDIDVMDIYNGATNESLLHLRLERLLSLTSFDAPNNLFEGALEKRNLIIKLIALKDEEDKEESNSQKDSSQHEFKNYLFKKMITEKLYSWLLHKVTEDGKGPNVLDDKGQGVFHLAAALGYDWAMKPIVTAGVSINFRDINGWTALHWAALCGREHTVGVLISLGAATGVLTDPSPDYPLGRTPADLASANGHKGISGFLAESSLTSYLSTLTVSDPKEEDALEVSASKAVQNVADWMATPVNDSYMPDELSLKDSLTAVCNATQAADRIHQVFRMQSFQRKQLIDNSADEFGFSDERALSVLSASARKAGQGDRLIHAAAVHIQKKFRGYKKRKEFLIIRQRIVKIQAHVRGHQVRKQYRTIIWSVGILEKVILRWRRKGSGLRGFKPDALTREINSQSKPAKEDDDYDFLKEGRKQTEERLQKALTRVKSMVQYPEARDQYRRLLTAVQGIRETKVCDMAISRAEETTDGDEDLIDIDTLLDDDTLMSITFD